STPMTMDALQQRLGRGGAGGPGGPGGVGAAVARGGNRGATPGAGGGATTIALGFAGSNNLKIKEELRRDRIEMVHAAVDLTLRRPLLVRTLLPTDAESQARFIEEAQITGQLQHPNIQAVIELGINPDGKPWMVMSRTLGKPLAELVDEVHTEEDDSDLAVERRERELLDVFLKICDAIAYAHSRGIIHRDLKPDVIDVGDFGDVIVGGWREAKPVQMAGVAEDAAVMSDRRAMGEPLTMEGTLIGTLPWMPPEQAAGRVSQLDQTADVYNLGAILYFMLTGTPPYIGDRDDEVLADIMEGLLEPPSQRAPHVVIRPELESIVIKAMASRPAMRYREVRELREAIEDYLAGRALDTARVGVVDLLKRWASSNLPVVIAVLVGLLALILLPVMLVSSGKDAQIKQLQDDIRKLQTPAGEHE
ncbi:MAG: serine/threonine-protein kinase, partial [Planctomycetota bacterium]